MHNGGYFQHILRPQPVDLPEHLFEDASLSSVSTMTASRAMESTYTANRQGKRVTQLQDSHRVSHYTPLKSLVNLADIAAGSVSSQSRSSCSIVSRTKDSQTECVPNEQENNDDAPVPVLGYSSKLDVTQFDAGATSHHPMSIGSVMADFSEEDESGWTSSAGNSSSEGSDSSSDVSIGTYLKSVCSTKSKCSVRSVETNKSSILYGEKCLPIEQTTSPFTPEKVLKREGREDDDSLEFSPDASVRSNNSRADPSTDNDEDPSQLEDQIENQIAYTNVFSNQSESGKLFYPEDDEELVDKNDFKSDQKIDNPNTLLLDRYFEGGKTTGLSPQGSLTQRSIDTAKSISLQDEKTCASDAAGSSQSCVRSVYLVPTGESSTQEMMEMGIDIDDASCPASNPVVISVQEFSPLADRIFAGDIILAVNDMDTTGWNSEEVKVLLSSSLNSNVRNMGDLKVDDGAGDASPSPPTHHDSIKLTVMSTEFDGSQTGSTSTQESMEDGMDANSINEQTNQDKRNDEEYNHESDFDIEV
jgi:hypothetical protein